MVPHANIVKDWMLGNCIEVMPSSIGHWHANGNYVAYNKAIKHEDGKMIWRANKYERNLSAINGGIRDKDEEIKTKREGLKKRKDERERVGNKWKNQNEAIKKGGKKKEN